MTLDKATIQDLENTLHFLLGGDMELLDMSYAIAIAHLLVLERDNISGETKQVLREMYLL